MNPAATAAPARLSNRLAERGLCARRDAEAYL